MAWTPVQKANAPATYTVDDGDPIPFNTVPEDMVEGLQPTNFIITNQPIFKTPTLAYGDHTVQVIFNGKNGTTPLTLYNLLVQRNDLASASSPASSISPLSTSFSGLPSPSDSGAQQGARPDEHPHVSVKMLVGLTVGGSFAVIIAVIVILCVRRRRRQLLVACYGDPSTQEAAPSPFPVQNDHQPTEIGRRKAHASLENTENPFDQELSIVPPIAKWRRSSTNLPDTACAPELSRITTSSQNTPSPPDLEDSSRVPEREPPGQDIQAGRLQRTLTEPQSGERGLFAEDSGLRLPQLSPRNSTQYMFPPMYTTH